MVIIVILVVLLAIFLPNVWAKYVLQKHSRTREEIPGTGGELAKHLVEKCELNGVNVEITEAGDHYDPINKVVRLSEGVYNGRSLTAVVVAGHEIGHAIQDHIGYMPLRMRTNLVGFAQFAERIGAIILVALPFITVLTRAPAAGALMFGAGLTVLLIPVVVHLITLPVEFDASFRRALPLSLIHI